MTALTPRLKILAIDDDPSIRELITLFLEDRYDVITASSAIEGLRRAKTERPNLILLDILMPGNDGIACLQELRALRETSNLPILMLTAVNDVDTRVKAFNAGADDFISKPIRAEELLARVQSKLVRMHELSTVTPLVLKLGNVALDLMQVRGSCNGQTLALSAAEFRILSLLMRRKGTLTSAEELKFSMLNSNTCGENDSVDQFVESLRRKLEISNLQLLAIAGGGYALDVKSES